MTTLLRAQPVATLPTLAAGAVLDVEDWDGPVRVTVLGWDLPQGRDLWVLGRTSSGSCRVRLFVPCER